MRFRLEEIIEVNQEVLYRYINNYGSLVLRRFPILRRTPNGAWISVDGAEKLVLNTRKRYAYPTEKEALVGFIKRTERHIILAEYNLQHAKIALTLAEEKEHDNP